MEDHKVVQSLTNFNLAENCVRTQMRSMSSPDIYTENLFIRTEFLTKFLPLNNNFSWRRVSFYVRKICMEGMEGRLGRIGVCQSGTNLTWLEM